MAWLAVDMDNKEWTFAIKPYRDSFEWDGSAYYVELPKGSIKKLIGKSLTWKDEPFEYK